MSRTAELHIRVEAAFVERLDAWRARQTVPPSRSAALRYLAEMAMSANELTVRYTDPSGRVFERDGTMPWLEEVK